MGCYSYEEHCHVSFCTRLQYFSLISYYCKQITNYFSRQKFLMCFPNNRFALWNVTVLLAKRFPHWCPVCSTRSFYHFCSYSLGAVFVVDRVSLSRRLWKPPTTQEAVRSDKTRIQHHHRLKLADSISSFIRSNSLHDGDGFDGEPVDCDSTLVKSPSTEKICR